MGILKGILSVVAVVFIYTTMFGPIDVSDKVNTSEVEAAPLTDKQIEKQKVERFITHQAGSDCRDNIRARSKYPSEIDFNWVEGNDNRYFTKDNGKYRVVIFKAGKMMNGLGLMVPFNGRCFYDLDIPKNSFKLTAVDID